MSIDSMHMPCQVEPSPSAEQRLLQAAGRKNIILKAAGHNTRLNLMYLIVRERQNGLTFMTLECTPTEYGCRVAKVVAKDMEGKILFTAIKFPEDHCLAIYSSENDLLAFESNGQVCDARGEVLLEISRHIFRRDSGRRHLEREHFFVNVMADHNIGLITSDHGHVRIGNKVTIEPKSWHAAVVLSYAAILHSEVYELDLLPIPEVTYLYNNEGLDNLFLFGTGA